MKKKIFYIIRYSVLQHSNAWKISRETDFETYKKNLFSDERLNLKRSLFQTLTLPCLAEQEKSAEDYETEIVLLVSKQLPSEQLEKINSLQQIVKFTVVEVDENESMYSKITTFISSSVSQSTEDLLYATVRIDDDDLLAKGYESKLLDYLTLGNNNYLISFPLGYESLINTKDGEIAGVEYSKFSNYPKVALGLAHIGFFNASLNKIESEKVHIYQTGKHTNVDERHTLIYDMTPDSYVEVAYALQDTRGEGFKNRTTDSASIDLENLRKKFPPLDGIF